MMLMDITRIIAELRAEHEVIDEMILLLERLQTGQGQHRRGRPPKWLTEIKTEYRKKPRGRRTKQRSKE
jgi:hypothetical protein